jgi:hypothetical protein
MIAKQQYTSTLTPSEKNAMYQYNREVQGITDVQPDYHPQSFSHSATRDSSQPEFYSHLLQYDLNSAITIG